MENASALGEALIPTELARLILSQGGDVIRRDRERATRALQDLRVPLDSQFAAFFLEYRVTLFLSSVSNDELVDLCEPTRQIASVTRFVHEVWGLPSRYVCFSSTEGEGGLLYDVESGSVYDFYLTKRAEFVAGVQLPDWPDFFAFLSWYLGGDGGGYA